MERRRLAGSICFFNVGFTGNLQIHELHLEPMLGMDLYKW